MKGGIFGNQQNQLRIVGTLFRVKRISTQLLSELSQGMASVSGVDQQCLTLLNLHFEIDLKCDAFVFLM